MIGPFFKHFDWSIFDPIHHYINRGFSLYHHSDSRIPTVTMNSIRCSVCRNFFPSEKTMWMHMKAIHGESAIQSNSCDLYFPREEALSRHQQKVEPWVSVCNIIEKCFVCLWKYDYINVDIHLLTLTTYKIY